MKASILYTHKNLIGLLLAGSLIAIVLGIVPAVLGLLIIVIVIAIVMSLIEPMIALGLAIIIGPLRALVAVVWTDVSLYPGQILFALFVFSWLVHIVLNRNMSIRFPVTTKLMAIYLCIALLSLWDVTNIYQGLTELIKWLQLLMVAVIVFNYCVKQGKEKWVIGFVLTSGCLQALIGIWQFAIRDTGPMSFELASGFFRAYGTFEQPNPFGGFMGILWPIALGVLWALLQNREPQQIKHSYITMVVITLIVTVLLVCALIASYSRGAWIGSIVAFLVMLFFLSSRPFIGVSLVTVTIAIGTILVYLGFVPDHFENRINTILEYTIVQDVRRVSIDETNFSVIERAAHWQAASKMIEAHPWLGVGMGNYQVVYPTYRLANWENPLGHAHNVYLNVAAETGVIGLGSYILFWGYVFLQTISVLRRSTNWNRGITLGLLGAWTHLGVHNFVDNLFVNNIHLCLGGLLGVLSVVSTRVSNKSLFV